MKSNSYTKKPQLLVLMQKKLNIYIKYLSVFPKVSTQ